MRNLDRSMMKTTTLQEAVLDRATTCKSTASMVPSGGAAARAPAKMATLQAHATSTAADNSCKLNCARRLSRNRQACRRLAGPSISAVLRHSLTSAHFRTRESDGWRQELRKRSRQRVSGGPAPCGNAPHVRTEPSGTKVLHERQRSALSCMPRHAPRQRPMPARVHWRDGCDSSPPGGRPLHLAPGGT